MPPSPSPISLRSALAAAAISVLVAGLALVALVSGLIVWEVSTTESDPPAALAPRVNGKIAFVADDGTYGPAGTFSGGSYAIDPDGTHMVQLLKMSWGRLGMITEAAWSPDGTRVAFVSSFTRLNSKIMVAHPDAAEPRSVTDREDGRFDISPAWSADGTRIAFARSAGGETGYDIYSIRPNGSELLRLTDDPADELDPTWSPDGRSLAYVRSAMGRTSLWVMEGVGSIRRPLLDCPEGCGLAAPAWSPLGDRIAFIAERRSGFGIDLIGTDGMGRRWIHLCGPPSCSEPPAEVVWSPDGSRLAVAFVGHPSRANPSLYVMDVDGSHRTVLPTGGLQACCLTWLPLEAARPAPGGVLPAPSLAFVSDRDGDRHVFVRGADGSIRNVSAVMAWGTSPAWSPDGTKLVFVGPETSDDHQSDLYVVNGDGTDLRLLLHRRGIDGSPAWSPDGRSIAFDGYTTVTEWGQSGLDIYLVDADGTGLRRLTANPMDDHDPSWSPDGRSLVYVASDGTSPLCLDVGFGECGPDYLGRRPPRFGVIDVTDPEDITYLGLAGREPAWSPDGQTIAYGDGIEVSIVGLDDGNGRRVTDALSSGESAGADSPSWSPDSEWIAFTMHPGYPEEDDTGVHVIHPDGSGLERLIYLGSWDPAWG